MLPEFLQFKLVDKWFEIVKSSHSMWAQYATGFFIFGPLALWLIFEIETNPAMVLLAATLCWLWGIIGRIKEQKLSDTAHKSWSRRIGLALVVFGAVMLLAISARAEPVNEAEFVAYAAPKTQRWEGVRNHAYLDRLAFPPVWTICAGQTRGVTKGMYMTDEECLEDLKRSLPLYRDGVHKYMLPETLDKRLPIGRDWAFTDLAYNVGVAGAGKSTAMRRLNRGDIRGACTAITWWNKAGGRVWCGLVNRRAENYVDCMEGLA